MKKSRRSISLPSVDNQQVAKTDIHLFSEMSFASKEYDQLIYLLEKYQIEENETCINRVAASFNKYLKAVAGNSVLVVSEDMPFLGMSLYSITGETSFLDRAHIICSFHLRLAHEKSGYRHLIFKCLLFFIHQFDYLKTPHVLVQITRLTVEILKGVIIVGRQLKVDKIDYLALDQYNLRSGECKYLLFELSRIFNNTTFRLVAERLFIHPGESGKDSMRDKHLYNLSESISKEYVGCKQQTDALKARFNAYFSRYSNNGSETSDIIHQHVHRWLHSRQLTDDISDGHGSAGKSCSFPTTDDCTCNARAFVNGHSNLYDFRFSYPKVVKTELNNFPILSCSVFEVNRLIYSSSFPDSSILLWAEKPDLIRSYLDRKELLCHENPLQELQEIVLSRYATDSRFLKSFRSALKLDKKRNELGLSIVKRKKKYSVSPEKKQELLSCSSRRFQASHLQISNKVKIVKHGLHDSQKSYLFTFFSIIIEESSVTVVLSVDEMNCGIVEDYLGALRALVLMTFAKRRTVKEALRLVLECIECSYTERKSVESLVIYTIRHFISSNYLIN